VLSELYDYYYTISHMYKKKPILELNYRHYYTHIMVNNIVHYLTCSVTNVFQLKHPNSSYSEIDTSGVLFNNVKVAVIVFTSQVSLPL